MRSGRMHQTTVRFTPDLWVDVEAECRRLGVSAAQYVREATLARLAYSEGRRGVVAYEGALADAGGQLGAGADATRAEPARERESGRPVTAQAEHVLARSAEARAQAVHLRQRARRSQ